MTKLIFSAVSAALILATSLSAASAQQAVPQGYVPQVATLDLSYLFRNHMRYKQLDEVLRGEISAAEQQFALEQKSMQELSRRLGEYKANSPEYKQTEEELAKRDADLRLRGAIMQKNFAEKKAKNYYDVLQEVKNCVKFHAEQHGILMVVNFNGDEIDGSNPQSVMRGLTDTVVYQHRSVDITPIILEMCNKNVPVVGAGTVPAAGVPR